MSEHLIYPFPIAERPGKGSFRFNGRTIIQYCSMHTMASATFLQKQVRSKLGLTLKIEPRDKNRRNSVRITVKNDAQSRRLFREHTEADRLEGYILNVTWDAVRIVGHDDQGAFWGAQTLLGMMDENGCVSGHKVIDAPSKPLRGVHVFMPARPQIAFAKRFIEMLSFLKYNTLFIEVGGGMEYRRHPEINKTWAKFAKFSLSYRNGGQAGIQRDYALGGRKNCVHAELGGSSYLTQEEVRDIVRFARQHHIEVIPEVQSLSHSYYLTLAHPKIAERRDDPYPDTCCPSNAQYYELYFDVLEEVIDVFQPKWIHIGHDEWYFMGLCPRCRGKSGADILAADVDKIHKFLTSRDIGVMMWGDKLMSPSIGWNDGQKRGGYRLVLKKGKKAAVMLATYKAVDRIPKDIVVLDWYWKHHSTPGGYFASRGFREVYGNFNSSRFSDWTARFASERVLGGEVSTWVDFEWRALDRAGKIFEILFSANPLWWPGYKENHYGRTLHAIGAVLPRCRSLLSSQQAVTGKMLPVDLEKVAAHAFPRHRLCGIAADAPQISVRGRIVAVGGKGSGPDEVLIPVGRHLDVLRLVHATDATIAFHGTSQTVVDESRFCVGEYRILLEGGNAQRVPIQYGRNICNYREQWGKHKKRLSPPNMDFSTVCTGADSVEICDKSGNRIQGYAIQWLNPTPGRRVVSVEILCRSKQYRIFLLSLETKMTKGGQKNGRKRKPRKKR